MERQAKISLYTDNSSFKEYLMMITSFNIVNYHFKIFHLLFFYTQEYKICFIFLCNIITYIGINNFIIIIY